LNRCGADPRNIRFRHDQPPDRTGHETSSAARAARSPRAPFVAALLSAPPSDPPERISVFHGTSPQVDIRLPRGARPQKRRSRPSGNPLAEESRATQAILPERRISRRSARRSLSRIPAVPGRSARRRRQVVVVRKASALTSYSPTDVVANAQTAGPRAPFFCRRSSG
jgi:hypothetical protein